ncbi:MAG: MerR family transcriptional regulator [Methanomicrobiales archaeon]|jgi:DNA-binding transcriptional MerR regulator
MDEDTTFLRFRDLVERTGLPEADVKRFLRTYTGFFTSTRQGRTRLYSPETVGHLKQIAELESVGTAVPTIKGILRGGQAETEGEGDPEPGVEGGSIAYAGENLTLGVLSDMKNLQEAVRDLGEQVTSLAEKVAGHEQRLIGHQQQLRILRRDLDEQKTETLAKRMEKRNNPFWKRLFPGKGGTRR